MDDAVWESVDMNADVALRTRGWWKGGFSGERERSG